MAVAIEETATVAVTVAGFSSSILMVEVTVVIATVGAVAMTEIPSVAALRHKIKCIEEQIKEIQAGCKHPKKHRVRVEREEQRMVLRIGFYCTLCEYEELD